MIPKRQALAFAALTLCSVLTANAAPKVTTIFPAGVARNQSTTVTMSGDFPQWPARVWCDSPGVHFESLAEKGTWKVTVDDNVASDIVWIRVTDKEGASSLRALIIAAPSGEFQEVEPNEQVDQLSPIALPAVINGKLAKGGDVDGALFELKKGQVLVASLLANNVLGSPVDCVLQLVEWTGTRDAFVVAQVDDSKGLDPRLIHQIPRDGKYIVRCFGFPSGTDASIGFAGAETFVYRLTVTADEFVEHTWPLSITRNTSPTVEFTGWNLPENKKRISLAGVEPISSDPLWWRAAVSGELFPTRMTLPIVEMQSIYVDELTERNSLDKSYPLPIAISACIDDESDIDRYGLTLVKDQKILLRVDSFSFGFSLDSHLQVRDVNGAILAENDDAGGLRDSELVFQAPADGQYRVEVRDLFQHGGVSFAYQLTAAQVQPDFTLTLPADSFVVTAEKPVEIVVAVERKNGFSTPIEISCENLPPGVMSAPVVSAPEGESAKSVKVVLSRDPSFAVVADNPTGSIIRISGRAENPALHRTASFAVAGSTQRLSGIWLTVP